MTIQEVIVRIENIPVTEEYNDREGNYIGKALTRWVDVKAKALEILKEFEKQKESEVEVDVEEEHLRSGD